MTVFISAGEVSGDAIAARIVTELRGRLPELRVVGLGGPRMRRAGVLVDEDTLGIGVVGVWETAATLPAVVRASHRLRCRVRRDRPSVALLIGNDVFNALLGRWLRRQGVHTIAYFPPQVWLWGIFASALGRGFDTILSSFDEEQEIYARACPHADVRYVGHYLADGLRPATDDERLAARRLLDLDIDRPVIGLFPGSRVQEIRQLVSAQIDAASRLHREDPRRQFVLPLADRRHAADVQSAIGAAGLTDVVRVLPQSSNHDVMRAADVLLVASGTTTLEAALVGTPMVILYRVTALTYAVVRASLALGLLKDETIGLPNILLKDKCVPEFTQASVRGDLAAAAVRTLLDDREIRARQVDDLARVRQHVTHHDAIGAVADTVIAALGTCGGLARPPLPADATSPQPTGAIGGP